MARRSRPGRGANRPGRPQFSIPGGSGGRGRPGQHLKAPACSRCLRPPMRPLPRCWPSWRDQEALLANKPLLTAVLTYHVLPGRSSARAAGKAVTTAGWHFQGGRHGWRPGHHDGATAPAPFAPRTLPPATGGASIDRCCCPPTKTLSRRRRRCRSSASQVEAVVAANLAGPCRAPGRSPYSRPPTTLFAALLSELA